MTLAASLHSLTLPITLFQASKGGNCLGSCFFPGIQSLLVPERSLREPERCSGLGQSLVKGEG